MISGIPVICVGIGRGDDAAIRDAGVVAVEDRGLAEKPVGPRRKLAENTELDDKRINEQKNTDIQD